MYAAVGADGGAQPRVLSEQFNKKKMRRCAHGTAVPCWHPTFVFYFLGGWTMDETTPSPWWRRGG